MKRLVVVLALAALMVACEKDPPAPTGSSGEPPRASADPTPPKTDREEGAEIPTEQDFEDEAAQKITAENLEEELAKLEKEIDQGG